MCPFDPSRYPAAALCESIFKRIRPDAGFSLKARNVQSCNGGVKDQSAHPSHSSAPASSAITRAVWWHSRAASLSKATVQTLIDEITVTVCDTLEGLAVSYPDFPKRSMLLSARLSPYVLRFFQLDEMQFEAVPTASAYA